MNSKPIRVMLVDDHPVVRAGFSRLLASDNQMMVITEADNGEESITLYKHYQPDVVVMDISMAGIGGMEASRRILAYDPDARLLVFSVHDNEAMIARTLQAGVLGYMSKRTAPTSLIKAVRCVAQGQTYLDPDLVSRVLRSGDSNLLSRLTPREFEVFRLLAEGNSVVDIATILSNSPKTVGVHQTRIMQKLELRTPVQLVRLALRCGVINT